MGSFRVVVCDRWRHIVFEWQCAHAFEKGCFQTGGPNERAGENNSENANGDRAECSDAANAFNKFVDHKIKSVACGRSCGCGLRRFDVGAEALQIGDDSDDFFVAVGGDLTDLQVFHDGFSLGF